jgi:glycosyltransferase involved in cell wall biosynthesis
MQYSFVVPIYNDGELAGDFCATFEATMRDYTGAELAGNVELIFVNDGSRNNSLSLLAALPSRFPFVKVIDLSRNFGQHIALSCGYENSTGDFVGMLNVDMEDSPTQIPLLLRYIQENKCDIVYGLRRERKGPWLDRLTSKAFQVLLNKLTGNNFPLNTSTLRVMNRKFVDAYNSLNEKNRYIPGLEMWLGFKSGFVQTEHQPRLKGRSSYNLTKRIVMAFGAIISFSDLPLRWSVALGFMVAGIGMLLSLVLIIKKVFFVNMQAGYTSTVSLIVLFSGIQMVILGMIGLYVGRILKEVQSRPLYIINTKYNF